MASVRKRSGPRGESWAVLYRQDNRQRSRTFATEEAARGHAERIERLGVAAADRLADVEQQIADKASLSLAWLEHD